MLSTNSTPPIFINVYLYSGLMYTSYFYLHIEPLLLLTAGNKFYDNITELLQGVIIEERYINLRSISFVIFPRTLYMYLKGSTVGCSYDDKVTRDGLIVQVM